MNKVNLSTFEYHLRKISFLFLKILFWFVVVIIGGAILTFELIGIRYVMNGGHL